MKKTIIMEQLNQTDLTMSRETTFNDYTNDLLKIQDAIVPIVMGMEYVPGMRIGEAIFKMEKIAREKNLVGNPTVRKGIKSLKTLNKEINICMAGRNAENRVARTLEFVKRSEVNVYRNVYLTDGVEETELDAVVVTDAGVIILEIKNCKDDMTITEDGRLIHSGDECYEKRPIGEKMGIKRKLLGETINLECARKGFKEDVIIDSYIVFVTPKGVRINLEDKYNSEKWCFRTSLNYRIENYTTNRYYRREQIEAINTCVANLEKQKRLFEQTIDYDVVLDNFAEAMEVLSDNDCEQEKGRTWKEKTATAVKRFRESEAGKTVMAMAPQLILMAAGPTAGAIGKAVPRAANVAAKIAACIKIAATKVPAA